MIGFIYLWVNKLNHKKYIGLHVGDENDGYIGSGVIFKKSISKYGIENFERTILHREYESVEKLYKKEFEIINEMNAVHSMEYYNMTNYDPKNIKYDKNGQKLTKVVTDETRKKISNAAKKRNVSEKTRKKMSEKRKGKPRPDLKGKESKTKGEKNGCWGKKWYNNGVESKLFYPEKQPVDWVLGRFRDQTGINNPFFGKKHSQKTIDKIKNTKNKNKTIKYGKNNPASVSCIIDGQNFDCLSDAAKYLNIPYEKFYRKYKRGMIK